MLGNSIIPSFNKYLSIYYVSNTILDIGRLSVSDTSKTFLHFMEFAYIKFQSGHTNNIILIIPNKGDTCLSDQFN